MILKENLINISNILKEKKEFSIFFYTKVLYSLLVVLKRYCVRHMYVVNNWILVIFEYNKFKKSLKFRVFCLKDKENFYKYNKLKHLYKLNKHGIMLTSKGICSISSALKMKQGGILLSLIYLH